MKRICLLKPMEPEHQTIHLNPGKNIIGRQKETGIRDGKCSRKQVQLDVDMENAKINLKVLGLNPCGINGLMGLQHTQCELQHGDVLEVVYGRHPFEVHFKPPPEVEKPLASCNKENMEVDAQGEEEEDPIEKENNEEVVIDEEALQETTADSWNDVEKGKMLVFTSKGVKASDKIASYDMDGTIIRTKSGNVFPKTCDDWMLNYPEVPKKLKCLNEDGFKICFFTNQGGIAKGKTDLNEFKQKIKQIISKLQVPVQAFIAITDGYYRKPLPGMWEHLERHCNNGVRISKEKSFYVGDAAGRPEIGKGKTKRRKDHSLADRLFAQNVGLKFYTPEEHFLGMKKEEWIRPEFDPTKDVESLSQLEPKDTKLPADECEMIIMVGLPGSGKSHFAKKNLASLGYTVANADTVGNVQACLKMCENALVSSKSCVVDNTNVDVESRKKFIELSKKFKVPCRCFIMNVSVAQVKHNIAFRQLTDVKHSKINEMLLNMMKKKFTQPQLEEGFTEIVKVNIKPTFERDDWKRLYTMYLVDK
ncbi:polynucleotide kinase 3'-phosphatase isoform X2 [Musca autumnalis]